MLGSAQFKKTLFIRFLAYFFILTGFLTAIGIAEPVVGEEITYRSNQFFQVKHELPRTIVTSAGQADLQPQQSAKSFGGLDFATTKTIVPVSTEFGIVIEKINANAKVVANVDPAQEAAYVRALAEGVAQAKGSTEPGQPGNLYIFSHSADAPWNIVRFNAVFYLLKELEPGDKIVLFYQGRRYNYRVYDKTVADPLDISFLQNRYDKPVLTLQTCDPPGTLLNRMIVRAQLEGS